MKFRRISNGTQFLLVDRSPNQISRVGVIHLTHLEQIIAFILSYVEIQIRGFSAFWAFSARKLNLWCNIIRKWFLDESHELLKLLCFYGKIFSKFDTHKNSLEHLSKFQKILETIFSFRNFKNWK